MINQTTFDTFIEAFHPSTPRKIYAPDTNVVKHINTNWSVGSNNLELEATEVKKFNTSVVHKFNKLVYLSPSRTVNTHTIRDEFYAGKNVIFRFHTINKGIDDLFPSFKIDHLFDHFNEALLKNIIFTQKKRKTAHKVSLKKLVKVKL